MTTSRRRARRTALALAVASTTLLVSCGNGGSGAARGGPADESLMQTSVVLGFTASPNFAAVFAALEQGYFAEEGLDVTIMPGGPGVEGESLVATGRADFVFGGLPDAAVAAQGGLPLVAVAARDIRTEFGLVLAEGSGISTPQDLAGRSVALSQFATPTTLFGPLLAANGVDGASVQTQTVAGTAVVSALLSGQVDAAGGGASTLLSVREQMPGAGFLAYSDFGIDVLGAGLVTRRNLVEENPELVGAMVRAFARGLEFTVTNPQEAVAAVAASYPDEISAFDDPVAVLEFVNKNTQAPYGFMPPELWQSTVEILSESGVLNSPANPEQYYTNEFVDTEK
jgi:NitT/TauT family transport system substrate-binding protein